MSTSSVAWEEGSLSREDEAVLRWRAEQFRELGFAEEEASRLAASEADLGQARYVLGSGCSPVLAFRILF
jgi:hypothetical protein